MNKWKVQIPTRLDEMTVNRIDEEIDKYPFCDGRSTMIRTILERFFKLLDEGRVQLFDAPRQSVHIEASENNGNNRLVCIQEHSHEQ